MDMKDRIAAAISRLVSAINVVDAKVATLSAGSDPWTYVKLGANALSTAVASADTALSFVPAANSTYEIEGMLLVQSAATTTGVQVGLKWPTAGITASAARVDVPISATAAVLRMFGGTVANKAAATGVSAINENLLATLSAFLQVGAAPAGAFTVTLASEVAASEARIMAGSFIRYRKVP